MLLLVKTITLQNNLHIIEMITHQDVCILSTPRLTEDYFVRFFDPTALIATAILSYSNCFLWLLMPDDAHIFFPFTLVKSTPCIHSFLGDLPLAFASLSQSEHGCSLGLFIFIIILK